MHVTKDRATRPWLLLAIVAVVAAAVLYAVFVLWDGYLRDDEPTGPPLGFSEDHPIPLDDELTYRRGGVRDADVVSLTGAELQAGGQVVETSFFGSSTITCNTIEEVHLAAEGDNGPYELVVTAGYTGSDPSFADSYPHDVFIQLPFELPEGSVVVVGASS